MSVLKLLLALCILLCVSSCGGYKILVVFPFPGKSHSILGDAFVKHILEGGHEVTYITAIPMKNPPAKLRQVDVSSNFALMPTDDLLDLTKLLKGEGKAFADISVIFEMMCSLANGTITHTEVQRLLRDKSEHYDAVIVEWMFNEFYCGFSIIFDCPLIWSSSMDPHSSVLSLIDEDTNPAYVTENLSSAVEPFTFWERVQELWRFITKKYNLWLRSNLDNAMFQAAFGSAASERGLSLPSLDKAKYTGSLMFGNSHYSTGSSIRLPQNYVHIGGYHVEEEVKPLPKDLKAIMDNAKNGVIYFSMGSVLKSRSMPEELKRDLLKMFGSLRQTVLWKFEEKLPNLPENVHIVHWAPQTGILSHPNCVLFITHGGLLSLTETIHYGVPVIGIPTFADQFANVNRAVVKGFAKRVDLDTNMAVNLKKAIKDILDNPEYKKRVKELTFVYHDRTMAPGKEIVHWVEHVIQTRGAPHLRSPALDMPFYQKMYLDLVALILFIFSISVFAVKCLFLSYKNNDLAKKNR